MLVYLNNTGHRWSFTTKQERNFILVTCNTRKNRLFDYVEALGNFAVLHFRYKGNHYSGFPEMDGSIILNNCRRY